MSFQLLVRIEDDEHRFVFRFKLDEITFNVRYDNHNSSKKEDWNKFVQALSDNDYADMEFEGSIASVDFTQGERQLSV
jgi:hypothetical protein